MILIAQYTRITQISWQWSLFRYLIWNQRKMDQCLQQSLIRVASISYQYLNFQDIEDIDLYVGGFMEEIHLDSMIGPVFKCIIGDQFARYSSQCLYKIYNFELISGLLQLPKYWIWFRWKNYSWKWWIQWDWEESRRSTRNRIWYTNSIIIIILMSLN